MRIAVAGLHTESSTYNPVPTTAGDFRQLRGQALLDDPYFAFLRDFDATFLPLLHARALPGGPVTASAYAEFKAETLEGLRVLLPLDGVYLAMHGAMFVAGIQDAEGDFISAVRKLVGPDCLIATSYDLHGNLSPRILAALDIFSTYRTAPHIDVEETMRRSVSMLIRALSGGLRPMVGWVPVPVLLPGERTSTEDEPARSFYAQLPGMEDDHVWDASFQVGYVWADEPRATAAAVVTGTDMAAMRDVAERLAADYWALRRDFTFGVETLPLDEAIARVLAGGSPAILADSGDNPTGGGVGDRADVLALLMAADVQDAVLAGIADPGATAAAFAAGRGATASLRIGGALDSSAPSIPVTARVMRLHDPGSPLERQAVLETGGIYVVVSARRRPYHNISDFTALGLNPASARIVVVKSGYLSPELAPLAHPAVMALSDGAVPQDIPKLASLYRKRPCFPWDDDFDWQPKFSIPFMADTRQGKR